MVAPQKSLKIIESKPSDRVIRILIADDHALFREGLRIILEEMENYSVVAEASEVDDVISHVRQLHPDLLLIDLQMARFSGMNILWQLSAVDPSLCSIVLTSSINEEQIEEALLLGAKGVVLKKSASSTLFQCIACVLAGQYWIGQKPASHIVPLCSDTAVPVPKIAPTRDYGLTPRELEILVIILEGKTNRELASQLSISQNTVKRHVTNIFDKLGVYNRLELALFAIHHEVIHAS